MAGNASVPFPHGALKIPVHLRLFDPLPSVGALTILPGRPCGNALSTHGLKYLIGCLAGAHPRVRPEAGQARGPVPTKSTGRITPTWTKPRDEIGSSKRFVPLRGCIYTRVMSHTRATVLSILGLLAGGALLIYLAWNISPYGDGDQLNPIALLMLLTGVFLLVGGAGGWIALALHRRWPALAGTKSRARRQAPSAEPALRQGMLAGLVVVMLVALAILRVLDVAVVIVTLLLAGLGEAYVQSRK